MNLAKNILGILFFPCFPRTQKWRCKNQSVKSYPSYISLKCHQSCELMVITLTYPLWKGANYLKDWSWVTLKGSVSPLKGQFFHKICCHFLRCHGTGSKMRQPLGTDKPSAWSHTRGASDYLSKSSSQLWMYIWIKQQQIYETPLWSSLNIEPMNHLNQTLSLHLLAFKNKLDQTKQHHLDLPPTQ